MDDFIYMEAIKHVIDSALGFGLEPQNLTFSHIALRGVIVFIVALIMVRLGDKRFLSEKTAFDAILGLILASMLARTINGSSAFWPTLGGGFVLVALHRAIAFIARHWHAFGQLVKGTSEVVIKDGCIHDDAMRRNDITRHDLEEDLRLNGVERPEDVRLACIERNGDISVVRKS